MIVSSEYNLSKLYVQAGQGQNRPYYGCLEYFI